MNLESDVQKAYSVKVPDILIQAPHVTISALTADEPPVDNAGWSLPFDE